MSSAGDSDNMALRLLEELVRCPSVTPEPAGVFDVLERALSPLGFAVVRLRFEGDGSYPVENIFATRGAMATIDRWRRFRRESATGWRAFLGSTRRRPSSPPSAG